MALRKASSYSKRYARPYTRHSSKKGKAYIKTVPPQKVVKFQMGDIKGFLNKQFKFIFEMNAVGNVQIRDTALEASRQFVHKELETACPGGYYFEVCVYPHHIMRENKMLTGAGADRMQTGMQLSFGKTIGRAAFLEKGENIFVVAVNTEKHAQEARKALEKIKAKLPGSKRIVMTKVN
ncbi:MAG: 50S ribosomal protein L16 [Nanoarchaeota archaeon]